MKIIKKINIAVVISISFNTLYSSVIKPIDFKYKLTRFDTLPIQGLNNSQLGNVPFLNHSGELIYKFVEQMPLFPGCENIGIDDHDKKKNCADILLMDFLRQNAKYPEQAREKGIQGQAVIKFVVMKDGSIQDAVILRDPGEGIGEAALQAVLSMGTQGVMWTPGKEKGIAVNTEYIIPVKFNLKQNEDIKKEPEFNSEPFFSASGKLIYKTVEERPRFPGCEKKKLEINEKKKCADNEFLYFLGKNVLYPEVARKNGIQGQTVIQFNVMSDGTIQDAIILRDPGGGLGEAARQAVLESVKKGLKWVPGMEKGEAVNVQYTVPLKFTLNGRNR